jgi:hypothetical protein
MIKKSLQTVLSTVVLLGCAADSSSDQQQPNPASSAAPPAEVELGTAFFGLTVKDCYAAATECFEGIDDPATWASEAASCRAELHGCFGDLVKEAVTTAAEGVGEIAQCGHDGLTCYAAAREFEAITTCRQSVELCVNGTVKDVTGIELPTTSQILDVVVETHGTAVAVKGEAAESVVGTAVAVTDVAADAIEGTITAAISVAGSVAMSAERLLECAAQAHVCMWDTADFFACSDAYQTCVTVIQ